MKILPAGRPPMKYFKRVPLPFKLISKIITKTYNEDAHISCVHRGRLPSIALVEATYKLLSTVPRNANNTIAGTGVTAHGVFKKSTADADVESLKIGRLE